MTHNPLIIALDVENAEQARTLVNRLDTAVDFYKVGMELYAAEGMTFVQELIDRGKRVFLDLKLYDIGETVKRTVTQIARTNVTFLTVHGSSPVLRAAVEGRGASAMTLLAVTVLTSYDQQDLGDLGFPCPLADLVALRVRNSLAAGVEGIVCSPLDASAVRHIAGPKPVIVTPGVRSASAATGDQKRIATPAEAVAAGATYLVIGRQVTRAKDPAAEAAQILAEIEAGA